MPRTDTGRQYQAPERASRFEIAPRMLNADLNGASINTHDAITLDATLGIHEFFETALTGTNNDISWIARVPGASSLSVVYTDPSAANASLSVSYATNVVTISLATNASSAITTTANQIIAAVNASQSVKNQVAAVLKGSDDGTGVVTALSSSALAANAGGLTLDVTLQYSLDGSNWFAKPGAFPQQSTVGSSRQLFAPLGTYSRWVLDVGGSGALFAVSIQGCKARWAR